MYKGKAIYNPSGKAGEYSYWACNFYTGCSNGCTYCYLKKGMTKKTLGGDSPELKKCFKGEHHALLTFRKELLANIDEIRKYGLFFTFTSDPFLKDTIQLTLSAITICNNNQVPVKLLTKRGDFIFRLTTAAIENEWDKSLIAIGFTLTGHDELEPYASVNMQRIKAMQLCKVKGYRTFASIEPIIDFASSIDMIVRSLPYCDLFKIGLESGKTYPKKLVLRFMDAVTSMIRDTDRKIYFKDSIIKRSDLDRSNLPECCVTRDYNLFN